MEVKQYLDAKKELQNHLIEFIDNQDDNQTNYENLITDLQNQSITENKNELKLFLNLLTTISNNHHRYSNFFIKIDQILSFLKQKIKQTFSNLEIFNIFKSNPRILFFFFKNDFFVNDELMNKIINKISYFSNDTNSDRNAEHKREIGENDSYICQLIREDLVVPFITYINQTNYPLSESIKSSIYETNLFLTHKNVTLLEYATFFGSIQIFKYLMINGCKLRPSLWLFAVHSDNAEIIHLLEENQIKQESDKKCLIEAIKCHHNNIANYFKDNYTTKKSLTASFQYNNYEILSQNEIDYSFLLHSCRCNYVELVKILLKNTKIDIFNEKIIVHFLYEVLYDYIFNNIFYLLV